MAFEIVLDKRVTLQSRVAGQDAFGAPSTVWANVIAGGDGKVWAAVVDLSGREFLAAGATQNATTTKITIRVRDGVVSTMRVLHGSDIYNIESTLRVGSDHLMLMCSKGVSLG